MTGSAKTTGKGEFTGRHMLIIMLSAFGVIIAVNLVLAYFAAGSWTGLVVKNSYVASQKFNKHLADVEAQNKRGWKSEFIVNAQEVSFKFFDSAQRPLSGFKIEAHIKRLIHERDDKKITLKETSPGVYGAKLALAPGNWQANLTARRAAAITTDRSAYYQNFRFFIKPEKADAPSDKNRSE